MARKPKSPPEPLPLPEPPTGLSEKSRSLWRAALAADARWSSTRLEILTQSLHALDRADAAKALVDTEGLVCRTESTGAIHVHPAAKLEREFRHQALRGFAMLRLEYASETTQDFLERLAADRQAALDSYCVTR
ncbi:MAG: hypothetical protein GXX96_06430 [Planctomycetaceae bacterium]|nr:hypothetical protein [Planctomycetaceae bacterium]